MEVLSLALIADCSDRSGRQFVTMLRGVGVQSVKLPPRSPNLNAYAERFVRSIKESCLERMILFGGESLRAAIHSSRIIIASAITKGWRIDSSFPRQVILETPARIQRRQRLGGHTELLLPYSRLHSSPISR